MSGDRFPLTLRAIHATYDGVTARSNRELLARLERDQERNHSENEWMRPDAAEQAFAARSRREFPGIVPDHSLLALLPASADPLSSPDPSRREILALHLAEIAKEALRLPAPAPATASAPADFDPLVQSVCTGCRGSCCRSGGDEAYLTEETLARVLHDHPGWDAAKVVESYLACLPAESVVDSCIYHSATGCGLPRELRSDTCNRYLCGKLTQLRGHRAGSPAPPVFAVFFDRGRWARTALIDETGCRVLADSAEE